MVGDEGGMIACRKEDVAQDVGVGEAEWGRVSISCSRTRKGA